MAFSFVFISSYSQTNETLQSVTERGNQTTKEIAVQKAMSVRGVASDAVGEGPLIYLYNNGAGANNYAAGAQLSGTGDIDFWIHNPNIDGWSMPRMRIAKSGNVGIGTTSPGYKLTVAGDSYTSGQFITEMNSPEGGAVNSVNNSKTGQRANSLKLYNMTGAYGDALCFWKYHANGTNGGPQLQLFDNGTSQFNGNLTLTGDQVNYGDMSIGTTASQKKLDVNGNIKTRKIRVTNTDWADYVFDSSYQLAPLSHVEKFIQENKHLPEVPSAAEVKKDGLDLGDNQVMLLKKIEELTLYIIQQNKELAEVKKRLAEVEAKQSN